MFFCLPFVDFCLALSRFISGADCLLSRQDTHHPARRIAGGLRRFAGPGPDPLLKEIYPRGAHHRYRAQAGRRGKNGGKPYLLGGQTRWTHHRSGWQRANQRADPWLARQQLRSGQADLSRLHGSGSPTAFVTRKEAGLDSLEKLRAATGIRIGAHLVGHITYINGRLAAYLLDLKEPKFVVGYSSPERDVALLQGEVDGGSMSRATIQQNPSLMEKVYFHTVITMPKGRYAPPYSRDIPEIDGFAKTDREHRLLSLYWAFDYPRWPYFLPPATPKELVNILREAMAKAFKDPGFASEFKKLTGADPSPIPGRQSSGHQRTAADAETIALYKHLADHQPMPPR